MLDLEALERRLGSVAEKYLEGDKDAPENHALLIKLVEERALVFRAEHVAKTERLVSLLKESPEHTGLFVAELAAIYGDGRNGGYSF